MHPKDRISAYERAAEVLRRIAEQYPEQSVELNALKVASLALSFALITKGDEFATYLQGVNRPLTDEQKDHLKKLGLTFK
jgi:hypothetical protein